MFFSVCLAASCASAVFAGSNEPVSSTPTGTTSVEPGTSQPALIQPEATNNSIPDTDRRLSPNDEITVTVYQEDELKTKTIIDKNGMVMLPLLNQVKISGMTTGQATALIQHLYDKDYLVNPQVNLIVEKFAGRHFAVMGQVQRPGSFDFPQNESVNLLQAIATAGGSTRLGDLSKVKVRRLENGSPRVFDLDAREMEKNAKKKPFEILPDDIINVGERTF